jgi:hypothetical protein
MNPTPLIWTATALTFVGFAVAVLRRDCRLYLARLEAETAHSFGSTRAVFQNPPTIYQSSLPPHHHDTTHRYRP